jgi:hypothetical protein
VEVGRDGGVAGQSGVELRQGGQAGSRASSSWLIGRFSTSVISCGCMVISFIVVFLVRPADRSGWSQVGRDGLLADLLGQTDDDPLGAADETEPVAVLVLRHLADEFGAVSAQAGNDVLNVFDGEHDAT